MCESCQTGARHVPGIVWALVLPPPPSLWQRSVHRKGFHVQWRQAVDKPFSVGVRETRGVGARPTGPTLMAGRPGERDASRPLAPARHVAPTRTNVRKSRPADHQATSAIRHHSSGRISPFCSTLQAVADRRQRETRDCGLTTTRSGDLWCPDLSSASPPPRTVVQWRFVSLCGMVRREEIEETCSRQRSR